MDWNILIVLGVIFALAFVMWIIPKILDRRPEVTYVKVPYYCKKCNKTYKIDIPEGQTERNVAGNVASAALVIAGGPGVFSKTPTMYCPKCERKLVRK